MASISVRGTKDSPRYYVSYKDVDGERKMRLLAGCMSKAEAKARVAKIESRIADGLPGFEPEAAATSLDVRVQPSGELMLRWLNTLKNRNAKDDKARVLKHVWPRWKDVPLAEIRLPQILIWMDEMRTAKDLSASSQRHNLDYLSRFFGWAIEHGYSEVNPVRMVPVGKRPVSQQRSDAPWLKSEEMFQKIMKLLPEPVNLIFYIGNRSGLRLGEIVGLRLSDMAFLNEGIIRVRFSYDGFLKEDKYGSGKSKWVPAGADAEEVLGPWIANRTAEAPNEESLLFEFRPAKPQNRRRTSEWKGFRKEYVEGCWERVVEEVGLEMTFYNATRHSFVTRSLAAGISLDEVSSAVGHSSPVVTRRFYDHFVRRKFSDGIRGVRPTVAR